MSVTVWMTSGQRRVITDADGADTDGFFVWFTAQDRRDESDSRRKVLTLRAQDVVRVEVERDGSVTGTSLGHVDGGAGFRLGGARGCEQDNYLC
jgi:hypothetical protein